MYDYSFNIIYLTYIDEIKSINIDKKNILKLFENNVNTLSKNFCNQLNKIICLNFNHNTELEKLSLIIKKKLEKKINTINVISSTKLIDDSLCKNPNMTFTTKIYKSFVDCKQCILPCLKINDNIFEWDINYDPNYSSYKLLNNLGVSFLSSIIFIKDGEKYYPEKVDLYIQDKYIKTIYRELIVGSDTNKFNDFNTSINEKNYNITNSPFSLLSISKIKIIITDANKIDQTLFSILYEKAEFHLKKLNIYYDGLCETHEILYTGNQSKIKITDLYGYYTDIRIVCNDLKNNIKTISLKNTDVTILKDIPVQLLKINDNIIGFSFIMNSNYYSTNVNTGFKIDQNNTLEIELDKKSQDVDIKIYGNKIILLNYISEFN